MIQPYVVCAVCHQKYRGKFPSRADHTYLIPRIHKVRSHVPYYGSLRMKRVSDVICLGSYQAAEDYID